MAPSMIAVSFLLVVPTLLCSWPVVDAQSQSSCTNVLISLSPCLNYITGNSSTPSSGCCSQLSSVVSSSPQCLCQVLNGGSSSLGININQTQALTLPRACNVKTPSVSSCNGAASPADAPAATATPDSPATVPSDGGSKTVPSSDNGTSYATSTKSSMPLLFVLLIATLSASTFIAA